MRKVLLIALALFARPAMACDPFAVYQQATTAYGSYQYQMPTSLGYFAPQYGYRIQAPTYVAPSPYSQIGFPAQTPVTIINNNNNNRGGTSLPAGASFGASFGPVTSGMIAVPGGIPGAQINVFNGRRFRFRN